MSKFNQRCYQLLKQVPEGKVTTYKDLAQALGTKAYRAVGRAMNVNPFAPYVPCHRVVHSDGTVGGYRFGVSQKQDLLAREGVVCHEGVIEEFEDKHFQFLPEPSDAMPSVDLLQALSCAYEIGEVEQLKKIEGGCIHKTYLLTTTKGLYVIKQLLESMTEMDLKKLCIQETISDYFSKAGLPAVVSLCDAQGKRLFHYEGTYWFVFPYISGVSPTPHGLTMQQLSNLADVLAAMHRVGKQAQASMSEVPCGLHYDTNTAWEGVIKKCTARALPLMDELNAHRLWILEENQKYYAHLGTFKKIRVISHNDLHALNLIWDRCNKPHIIDWEYAGMIHPELEACYTALELSGIFEQALDSERVHVFLCTYQQHISITLPAHVLLSGFIGHRLLPWLYFNLNRAIEDPRAHEASKNVFKTIRYIKLHEEKLLDDLSNTLCLGGLKFAS